MFQGITCKPQAHADKDHSDKTLCCVSWCKGKRIENDEVCNYHYVQREMRRDEEEIYGED